MCVTPCLRGLESWPPSARGVQVGGRDANHRGYVRRSESVVSSHTMSLQRFIVCTHLICITRMGRASSPKFGFEGGNKVKSSKQRARAAAPREKLPRTRRQKLSRNRRGHELPLPPDRTERMRSTAEESPRLPSLLDDPACTCNGSFDYAAREWHHHASCPAFGSEGGKICGH